MVISAKPSVESLKPYVAPLEGRRGMLRLDFNENTVGPSPKVLDALRALPPSAYATYPEYEGLTQRYADFLGVPRDRVGLHNGVDAVIKAVFDAYGSAGEVFLQATPTFSFYAPCALTQAMKVESIPYNDDLSYPLDAVRSRLTGASPPRMLFICNPNNPTGTLLPAADCVALARAAPHTLVVIDELYSDFTGVTVLPEGLDCPNLLVLRSLSKTQGIAALRIGFAIGDPTILDRLSRVTGPYDVGMFGVVAARAALDDDQHTRAYVAEVLRSKAWTVAELRAAGLRVHAAGGNYVLVWPGRPTAAVEQALRQRGILVRNMDGKPLISGSFRLSIGTGEQMRRFVAELRAVLRELGAKL